MNKSEKPPRNWTKPELKRLGTIREVQAKGGTQQDGNSSNFNT